jgi:hypothetical protein
MGFVCVQLTGILRHRLRQIISSGELAVFIF